MHIDRNARTILLTLTVRKSDGERERDFPRKARFQELADSEMGFSYSVAAGR
jgi:hypothetical protein